MKPKLFGGGGGGDGGLYAHNPDPVISQLSDGQHIHEVAVSGSEQFVNESKKQISPSPWQE